MVVITKIKKKYGHEKSHKLLKEGQTHRPDLKLCSTVGLEEHCLGSKGSASPLDNVAVQLKEELTSTNPYILVENEEPGRVMFVNLQFLLQDGHRPQVKIHLMKQCVISRLHM